MAAAAAPTAGTAAAAEATAGMAAAAAGTVAVVAVAVVAVVAVAVVAEAVRARKSPQGKRRLNARAAPHDIRPDAPGAEGTTAYRRLAFGDTRARTLLQRHKRRPVRVLLLGLRADSDRCATFAEARSCPRQLASGSGDRVRRQLGLPRVALPQSLFGHQPRSGGTSPAAGLAIDRVLSRGGPGRDQAPLARIPTNGRWDLHDHRGRQGTQTNAATATFTRGRTPAQPLLRTGLDASPWLPRTRLEHGRGVC
jgi:hypothetical protein